MAIAFCGLIFVSCTGKKGQNEPDAPQVVAPDTIASETGKIDWDVNSAPVYIMCDRVANIHVIDSEVDSAIVAANINTYNTFACSQGTSKLSFKEFQTGEAGYGNLVRTEWETGFLFNIENTFFDPEAEYPSNDGLALNDAFLKDHQVIPFRYFNPWNDAVQKAPLSLIKTLRAKYNNARVKKSTLDAQTSDKNISIYSVQFDPQDTVCVAMRVVTVGDSLYILDETTNSYNDMSAWHVDDGGEYGSVSPTVITQGPDGLDIFYVESAPESTTLKVLLLRDGQIYSETFFSYYHYVDFRPSLKPVELPATAVLQDEQLGYKVWINEDKKPEGENYGVYTVYYSQPESEKVYRLLTTNPDLSVVNYEYWPTNNFAYTDIDKVVAADNAKIVPLEFNQVGVILSGCPDARNEFSYLIRICWNFDPDTADWLPANSGFCGLDDDNNFKLMSYQYDDNGRYNVMRYFTRLGQFVRQERVQEAATPQVVDLGLSVKWASLNVGATRPDDYGHFYAWGEIEPKSSYSDNSYYYEDFDREKLLKYGIIDQYGCLTPAHDPAATVWGDGWRMPTAAEFEELAVKCRWEEEQYPSDVRGYKITGPNGNWIFLPTGGEMSGEDCINFGFYGNYWTSSIDGIYAKAMRYSIPDDSHDIQRYNREAGFNVRAVKQ